MEREKDNINTFDNMLVISALREKKRRKEAWKVVGRGICWGCV